MLRHEKIEHLLKDQGITWEVIPKPRHIAIEKEWTGIYGQVFGLGMRQKRGGRAEVELHRQSAKVFLVVPFHGSRPDGGFSTSRPNTAAYECHGSGELPEDLAKCDVGLDFFVSPPDLRWTMVYTHEDGGLVSGPRFIDREWLVPPTRKLRPRKRTRW